MSSQTCTYDQFDLTTLEPLNEPTRVRLAEVDFRPELFKGRSVLDIGANSGLLSIEAWRKGASSITAIDVQDVCIESLNTVFSHHQDMPMTVAKRAVSELDPQRDLHDIVLFFEVIHWTTSQGLPIPDAIELVANVTAHTLLIEFPWDIREPSIRAKTSLTIDDYDSSLIMAELSDRFHEISFMRFMSYFKGQKGSRRALVRASRPKLSPALFSVEGFRPAVENPISQGVNESSYVRSLEQDFFMKQIPAGSGLGAVPTPLLEDLFDSLDTPESPILCPKSIEGRRVHTAGTRRVLAYPWLGESDGSLDVSDRPGLDEALELGMQATKALGAVDPDLVAALRESGLGSCPQGQRLADLIRRAGEFGGLDSATVSRAATDVVELEVANLDHLVHGDLHRSNMIRGADGAFVVTDMDTLTLGTPWTDVLWQVGFQGFDLEEASTHISNVHRASGLDTPNQIDFLTALGLLLGWCHAVRAEQNRIAEQLDRVRRGVATIEQLAFTR